MRKSLFVAVMWLVSALMVAPWASAAPADHGGAVVQRLDTVESPWLRAVDLASFQLPTSPDAEWQREYDAASAKRRSGRLWMLIGGGVAGAGVAMFASKTGVREDCDMLFCTVDYRLPGAITASGVGLMTMGIIRQRDAGRTLRELEAQRGGPQPRAGATLLPVGDRIAVSLTGRGVGVVNRLEW
jgi:hypothetical protein